MSDTLDSKMAAELNITACNLGSKADRNAIPMANQTFSGSRHPVKKLFWTCGISHIALCQHPDETNSDKICSDAF